MLKHVLTICAVLFGGLANAQAWVTDEKFADPMTREPVMAATSTNASGYRIAFFRNSDTRVRVAIFVPDASFDQLARKGRIAALRADSHPVKFIETNSLPGLEQPFSTGAAVRDIIWHGQDYAPFHGTLRNIMDGSKLTVRLFTDMGTTIDTTFELTGAAVALSKALGVPETLASEAAQNALAASAAKANAAQRCYVSSAPFSASQACMAGVTRCTPRDVTKFDATAYQACLKSVKFPPA